MLLTGLAAGQPTETDGVFVGLTLRSALQQLREAGLPIVFTDRLVKAEMVVAAEPRSRRPRAILDELLSAHGLRAVSVEGALVVVASPSTATTTPSISGRVTVRASSTPLAGAEVSVRAVGATTVSGRDGRFVLDDLEPGRYLVETRRAGYLPEAREVEVRSDPATDITIDLVPAPFVHEEILVRPGALSLLEEEPAGPLSLERRTIEALPQLGGDVFRSLTLVPGVTANDLSVRFSIHGGRGDETRIVLDGQELYEPFHLQDYDSALSMVAVETLDRVNLNTGTFAAEHGDRMGGVLDLTTRTVDRARETRFSLSILDLAASSGGPFNRRHGNWLLIGRRGSIDLAGRIFGADDPAFWDTFGKIDHDLGGSHRIRGSVLRAADSLRFEKTTEGDFQSADTNYDSSYTWGSEQAILSARLTLESSLSWTSIRRLRRGSEAESEQSFSVLDRRELGVLAATQSFTLTTGSTASIRWGWESRDYEADYEYTNNSVPALIAGNDEIPPRGESVRVFDEFDSSHLGLWLVDRRRILGRVTSEVGVRWDRYTLTDEEHVSPRLNFAVQLGKESVVRAGWGRFLQSQRPNELSVQDGERAFSANERASHSLLGYERRFAGDERALLGALRVELYREAVANPRPRYENLFEPFNFFPEVEPDRVLIAPTRSLAEGLEAVLRGAVGERTDWWLSYAYSEAKDRIGGAWRRRRFDQPHALAVNVAFRLPDSWFVSAAWRYRSGWPTTPLAGETRPSDGGELTTAVVPGPLNSSRLSGYHRLDVRASHRVSLGSGTLTFFADVQNLYNRRNQAGFDVAIDGDTRQLAIATERWAGLFPSLGVTFEF